MVSVESDGTIMSLKVTQADHSSFHYFGYLRLVCVEFEMKE